MSLLVFFAYLGVGRLITWLIQTNGLLRPIRDRVEKIDELLECDLCTGFWVYLCLGLLTEYNPFIWPYWAEIIILAALVSFIAHLLRLGWQVKFGTVIL